MLTIEQIREVIRQELKGEGKCIEFADLTKVEGGDSAESIIDYERDRVSYCQATDDFTKLFEPDGQELKKTKPDVVRSRMAPARQETEPEVSAEEFFGECTKRASNSYKIKLTKRLCSETGEVMVEHWNAAGECIATTFIPAGQDIPGDSVLAKASITDSMLKTLTQIRAALLPEEIEAATKAVKALDVDAFLQICRRAQVTV
jgi:hypothetical protein